MTDGAASERAPRSGEGPGTEGRPERVCSAKGCRDEAAYILAWNNPRLHPPERRKTWLACAAHRDHLAAFLGARGFLKETVPLDDRDPDAG